jgi:hypothetical protein
MILFVNTVSRKPRQDFKKEEFHHHLDLPTIPLKRVSLSLFL